MIKSQSAMEYLMTYGWAILIIAVVLGVMFQLGVFSSGNIGPKASPGSCTVQRLLGQVSLEGQCAGLLPQYVQDIIETASVASYDIIQAPTSTPLGSMSTFTVSAWVSPNQQLSTNPAGSSNHDVIAQGEEACSGPTGTGTFALQGGSGTTLRLDFCVETATNEYSSPIFTPATGKWYFATGTFNGFAVCLFVNGTQYGSCTATSGSLMSGYGNAIIIGDDSVGTIAYKRAYNGTVANVQIYNTTLSSSEIKSLYQEGIGGAPVRLQNLVAWWPLDGNMNDYSGLNSNGQVSGQVAFNGTWSSGYTPP